MFHKNKSSETPDLFFLKHLIELVLTEQRHQRGDLSTIKRQLHSLITDDGTQKQVSDFYQDSPDISTGRDEA